MIAVVGAGLGGLAAAVTLAKAGREVVVLEQGHRAGGVATSFSRPPYTFEASLHSVDAAGPGEPNAALLDELGVLPRVTLRPLHGSRREVWLDTGVETDLPHGRDRWLGALAARFPDSLTGATALFDLAARMHAASYAWVDDPHARPGPEALPLMGQTAAQAINAHVPDPDAARAVGTLASYLGLGADQLGALPFLVLLHGYHALGPRFPDGGSQSFTNALVAELESHGGRIELDTPVTAIRSRRRQVRAVEAGGERPVEGVVAACSPVRVFGEMLDAREVPGRYRARLEARTFSTSLVTLHLGVRDLAGLPDHAYESGVYGVDDPRLAVGRMTITARHLADRSFCPSGHGVFTLSTPWPGGTTGAQPDGDTAAALIELAERHFLPGLGERVEARSFATPQTFARYTLAPQGAIFGFAMTPRQSAGRALPPTTPIRGLVLAGGWVQPGAGQTAAMLSGRQAARALLRELG